jgi:hypothetical protein
MIRCAHPPHPSHHRCAHHAPRIRALRGALLVTALGLLLFRAPADAGEPARQLPSENGARSNHWSLQPFRAEPTSALDKSGPGRRNLIDHFVQNRLAEAGLGLNPEAERLTLLRRLTFDLVGLPPTPEEIDAFLADSSAGAYERQVERLLASPRYGERWGRHWLDVARYTESQGFEYDKLREQAWHYRDYVIRSFNEDKPYERFMKEQIAGDVLEPVSTDGIIGASLLVCGPWDEAGNSQANATQKAITREEELEDLISVVGQTFLGLTINCARCHSHKFDPIPQQEYYRIKSVFEGVKHGERPLATPAALKEREARLGVLKQERTEAEQAVIRLQTVGWQAAARDRGVTTNELRQIPQPELLAALTPGQRQGYDQAVARRVALQAQLDAFKVLPTTYAGTRVEPAPTRTLKRGDVKSPEEIVKPGALSAIANLDSDFGLPPDAPEAQRRLAFANWLAAPQNPLPARVMANRVWHLHFGQGLVATPNDFGASGAHPTHPELLDWLARQFIDSGWSVKTLHRLIVTSAVYRQSSRYTEAGAERDADNLLLWRFPPHRLEAEALRDAILTASGQLNLAAGGPSVRPFEILKFPANAYIPVDKVGPEFNRRSVYRMNVNSGKDPLLDAFDCPDPSVKTPRRGVTTTPLQALGLMNNSFVQRQATHLAERVLQENQRDLKGAVRGAYRHALGRHPTPGETQRALAAAVDRGLAQVCWALLNSTEFLYVR